MFTSRNPNSLCVIVSFRWTPTEAKHNGFSIGIVLFDNRGRVSASAVPDAVSVKMSCRGGGVLADLADVQLWVDRCTSNPLFCDSRQLHAVC